MTRRCSRGWRLSSGELVPSIGRVQSLLSPDEFVRRAMAAPGIRWVRWRSDWEACDCFGIIVLWFREVLGVDLGSVPQTDIASGFEVLQRDWVECGPQPGSTGFMTWRSAISLFA